MNSANEAPLFYLWSFNKALEGPVELPAVVARVRAGQLNAKSWIFADDTDSWRTAGELPELRPFFKAPATPSEPGASGGLRPGMLRRIKLFADMDDTMLSAFVKHVEILKFNQFATVVQKGQHGDSMFLVLEGELRARTIVDGREVTLSTMGVGDFFGEIALLDHGPRSLDVLANTTSSVLKISAESIDKVTAESPAAAAKFLHTLAKYVAGRTRALTKRYEDTIHFSRAAAQVGI